MRRSSELTGWGCYKESSGWPLGYALLEAFPTVTKWSSRPQGVIRPAVLPFQGVGAERLGL
ncbi:MAG TPA: hypothetical protein PKL52_00395, partial [Tenuifilaceae bacterium]|nr:hypothetical protein [Tenuifilaceae bacterium]